MQDCDRCHCAHVHGRESHHAASIEFGRRTAYRQGTMTTTRHRGDLYILIKGSQCSTDAIGGNKCAGESTGSHIAGDL